MNKKFYSSLVALVVLLTVITISSNSNGQTKSPTTPASPSASKSVTNNTPPVTNTVMTPLTLLPTSDAVVTLDVQRLLTDILPRALASDSTKLAQVNASIDQFKTRTGIDMRSLDRIAVGTTFSRDGGPAGDTSKQTAIGYQQNQAQPPGPNTSSGGGAPAQGTVAVAQGRFNTGTIVAAGRLAANGKYQEQQYNGKTIYTFSLNEQVKILGVLNVRISDLAVAAIDANTLAFGQPTGVRAALDANAVGRGVRVSSELIALATRNTNSVLGFGGNVPPSIVGKLDFGNEEIAKSIASVRQFYGSVGATTTGYEMLVVGRTENADQAKSLSDTVAALKQFAPFLTAALPGNKGKLAQNALEALRVSTQSNEVQLRLELAQTDIAMLLAGGF